MVKLKKKERKQKERKDRKRIEDGNLHNHHRNILKFKYKTCRMYILRDMDPIKIHNFHFKCCWKWHVWRCAGLHADWISVQKLLEVIQEAVRRIAFKAFNISNIRPLFLTPFDWLICIQVWGGVLLSLWLYKEVRKEVVAQRGQIRWIGRVIQNLKEKICQFLVHNCRLVRSNIVLKKQDSFRKPKTYQHPYVYLPSVWLRAASFKTVEDGRAGKKE
jgi:hypothetical protein